MSETSEAKRKETRDFKTIKVEVEGPLGRLVLNRPERLNAVNATVLQELAERPDVGDVGKIGQPDGLLRQQRRGQAGQRGVLRARDRDLAREPDGAFD